MRAPTPEEHALFDSLCATASPNEIEALRRDVAAHVGILREAARMHELLPVDLALELAQKLDSLLDQVSSLPDLAQPLVVGAARYFASTRDVIPDRSSELGLDDDVAVFNLMARRIGRGDLEVDE